ncbi:MAG: hypothetical protein QGG64_17895, partial [Candidatus Latescibacteria bacterium]|nr:hypothetical protein [Candidatus Latescibacterota bacterium]
MRIATLELYGREVAAIRTSKGYVTLERVNAMTDIVFPTDLGTLLTSGQFDILKVWYDGNGRAVVED